jgi:hypothetical protein
MSFYALEPDGGMFGTKWAYGEPEDPVHIGEGTAKTCPVCGRAVSGLRWLPPQRLKLSSAKPQKWGDFVWGAGFDLMVSERFKRAYEEEGLSGIDSFEPVEVVRVGTRKRGDLPEGLPAYYLVDIVWGAADLDDDASEIVRRNNDCAYCRGGPISHERIVIEDGSWTGEDIFVMRSLARPIMVSERFRQMVERRGLRNTMLIPSRRYAYDEHRTGTGRGMWYVREDED